MRFGAIGISALGLVCMLAAGGAQMALADKSAGYPAAKSKQLYADNDFRGKQAPKLQVEKWIDGPAPDTKGKVVLIDFWATWCGPCRQEMPLLEQIQTRYEPLGFTIVGINVEPDSDAAQAWLTKVPVTFPILFDRENKVAESFGVDGMPSTVFIDRTGAVRYVHRGYRPGDEAKYADMVRSLVKE